MTRVAGRFANQLRALYLKAAPKSRETMRSQVERLFASGVRSTKDLGGILGDGRRDGELRLIACRALWVMRDRRSVPALVPVLVRTLRDDENMTLVNEAGVALDTFRAKASIPLLIKALTKGKQVGNRVSAAWTLGNLKVKSAVPALLRVLVNQSEDGKVRGEAADALGSIDDRRAVVPLIRALQDPEAEVRFWAAYALGKIGDLRAVAHLERLAGDETAVPDRGSVGKEATDAIDAIRTAAGWRKPKRKAARPSARRTKGRTKPTARHRRGGKAR